MVPLFAISPKIKTGRYQGTDGPAFTWSGYFHPSDALIKLDKSARLLASGHKKLESGAWVYEFEVLNMWAGRRTTVKAYCARKETLTFNGQLYKAIDIQNQRYIPLLHQGTIASINRIQLYSYGHMMQWTYDNISISSCEITVMFMGIELSDLLSQSLHY